MVKYFSLRLSECFLLLFQISQCMIHTPPSCSICIYSAPSCIPNVNGEPHFFQSAFFQEGRKEGRTAMMVTEKGIHQNWILKLVEINQVIKKNLRLLHKRKSISNPRKSWNICRKDYVLLDILLLDLGIWGKYVAVGLQVTFSIVNACIIETSKHLYQANTSIIKKSF